MRILIIEDEIELAQAIADGLRMDGYAVDICDNGEDGYELLYVESYDLVVLDLNLPKRDGFDVLMNIRQEKPDLNVLILSARSSVEDKVRGLNIGANDYLCKPFDFAELEARISGLLRRSFTQEHTILTHGTLQLDLLKRCVYVDKCELQVTKKEFALLEYFLLHKEKVIQAEELIAHVWDANADFFSGAIRVHISSLRKKLKAALHYDPIQTKIGEGYCLSQERGDIDV